MVTQAGDNTCVIGIRGNFDDAQNGVKQIFTDKILEKELSDAGFVLSSANSINIGRLVPQIVYYVYAYCSLLREGSIRVNDVAAQVGFQRDSYFISSFKQRFGLTPGAYCRQMGGRG